MSSTSVFIENDVLLNNFIEGNAEELKFPEEVALVKLREGTHVLAVPIQIQIQRKPSKTLNELPELIAENEQSREEIDYLLNTEIAKINSQLILNANGNGTKEPNSETRQQLLEAYDKTQKQVEELQAKLSSYRLALKDANGLNHFIAVKDIESYHFINRYSTWDKVKYSASGAWQFITEAPKQLYASGGVFPAVFGTVVMVLLMTVLVTPLGVMVAIYLHEYAAQNRLTTLVRISINNLAGVPSIVYGVFGLGFFVYELGAGIDKWFFEDALPAPTFGAPGLFWASLTMAMLTLPVVVVATEEGLRRVPDSLRMGSYALGATQFETIRRTVIPMASPGIMTGVILAIARGAGEVAPLIFVGAVKYAPTLPIDSEYPFVHFERQFMHLGVTIFDGAFQGQLADSRSNMMFAACLFLLLIVLMLNIFALLVRHRLRRRYNALQEY